MSSHQSNEHCLDRGRKRDWVFDERIIGYHHWGVVHTPHENRPLAWHSPTEEPDRTTNRYSCRQHSDPWTVQKSDDMPFEGSNRVVLAVVLKLCTTWHYDVGRLALGGGFEIAGLMGRGLQVSCRRGGIGGMIVMARIKFS